MLSTILAYSTSNYTETASLLTAGTFGIASIVIGIVYLLIYCVFFILMIGGVILWIVMLIDVIQRDENEFPNSSKDSKMLWLLIILLTSYIGALIYYFMVYKKLPRKKTVVEKK